MGRRIELPQLPKGETQEQLQALYGYLYRMAEALNNNLAEIGNGDFTDEEMAVVQEITGGSGTDGIPAEAETLKSLIIKTAQLIKSEIDEYNLKLIGTYTAEGKLGRYVRKTRLDVDVTPTGIQQNYTFQDIIQGLKTYEVNAKNYIKTGLLRTVSSIPVYGVAIGKDVVTFSEDGTETYNDGNKVAELTADELSFWQSGNKVASYTGTAITLYSETNKLVIDPSDGMSFYKNNVLVTRFKEGRISFYYDGNETFYILNGKVYVAGDMEVSVGNKLMIISGAQLIIESGNLQLDANGNLTINGGGTFTGELSAATGTFAGTLKVSNWEFGSNGQINEKELSAGNTAHFRLKSDSEAIENDKYNCGISYGFSQQQWSAYTAFVPYITFYGGYKNVNGRVADLRIMFHPKNGTTGYQSVTIDTVEASTGLEIIANEIYPKSIPGYNYYKYCGKSDSPWDYGYFKKIEFSDFTDEQELSVNNIARFRMKRASESLDGSVHNCGISYGYDVEQWSQYTAYLPHITLYGGFNGVNGRVADLRIMFHPKNGTTGYQSVTIDTVEASTGLEIIANDIYPKTIPGYSYSKNCGKSSSPWDYGYFTNIVYTNMTQNSSRDVKHDIRIMDSCGEKLDQLKPVTFIYNDDRNNRRRPGLIYEETAEVLPEICQEDEGGKGINYVELVPMLLKEIQELRARVKALEER